MNDAVRIEKIGEQPDESGGVVHSHDVYEGDSKIGSFHTQVSPQGKLGFKLKGVKTKHVNHILDYMRTNYEQPPVAKAMADDGMTAKSDTTVPQVELNHDRLRIKRAVVALLGKKETPHSPDGKINKAFSDEEEREWLAKSTAAQTLIDSFRPQINQVADDLSTRSDFAPHHDHAAYLITHASHQLDMADRHLNRPKPSVASRVRSVLGLKPTYLQHLQSAGRYLRSAQHLSALGDRHLNADDKSHPSHAAPLPQVDREDRAYAIRATKGNEQMISGLALKLKDAYAARQAQTANTATPNPSVTTPAATAPTKNPAPASPGTSQPKPRKNRGAAP
jgi:hypothetical protein